MQLCQQKNDAAGNTCRLSPLFLSRQNPTKKNIGALSLKLSACSLQLHFDKLTPQISSLALVLSFARIIVFLFFFSYCMFSSCLLSLRLLISVPESMPACPEIKQSKHFARGLKVS